MLTGRVNRNLGWKSNFGYKLGCELLKRNECKLRTKIKKKKEVFKRKILQHFTFGALFVDCGVLLHFRSRIRSQLPLRHNTSHAHKTPNLEPCRVGREKRKKKQNREKRISKQTNANNYSHSHYRLSFVLCWCFFCIIVVVVVVVVVSNSDHWCCISGHNGNDAESDSELEFCKTSLVFSFH